MSPIRLAKPLILGVLAICGLGGPVQAEEGTARALMPWEGEGRLYPIGLDRVLFIGSFEGIMYVETGKNRLDGLLFECPTIDEFSADGSSTNSRGFCILTGQYGDTIFAEYTCKGSGPEKCRGEFRLTAGTGQFEGITGSGPIESRSVLSGLAANTSTGHTVQGIAGIAILPELKFNIPERK